MFAPQPVGVTDDFFEDLGGHSLRAARMVSIARADEALRVVSIQDLYLAPTIRALAERLTAAGVGAGPTTVEEPFHPVPQMRRTLCVIAQTLALIPIFAFAGVQWIFPYLAYTALATPELSSRLPALAVAGAAFVVIPPVAILFSIVVKWVVIGRYKVGDYPLWGSYYFRWWFVRRFLAVMPTQFLSGTPFMVLYYRLLGAEIGKGAFLSMDQIDAPDLVSIGEDAIISDGALFATTSVERGLLRIGRNDVGARAFVGTMAVIGRNAKLGDDAVLEDLSAIPTGESVPNGELWTGSPAIRVGPAPLRAEKPKASVFTKALVTLGLTIAAPLLPLAAVLPIAPGLLGLIEIDWVTKGYSYLILAPLLAVIYVVLMCTLTVVVKWALLGRVKPGLYPVWSWFYVRYWFVKQLSELALDLLHPIYATLYVAPWYRALGAKVGARAEVSTATSVTPDLIEIGDESFIADGVVFGAARAEPGAIRLERTRIGRRSFIGNSGLLPTGADIGDEVLIGVLSKPPADAAKALQPGSTWFGSPAIRLPHRQVVAVFDEGSRFRPAKRLIATRLAIEFVRIILSLTVFIGLFSALLTIVGDLSDLKNGPTLDRFGFSLPLPRVRAGGRRLRAFAQVGRGGGLQADDQAVVEPIRLEDGARHLDLRKSCHSAPARCAARDALPQHLSASDGLQDRQAGLHRHHRHNRARPRVHRRRRCVERERRHPDSPIRRPGDEGFGHSRSARAPPLGRSPSRSTIQ